MQATIKGNIITCSYEMGDIYLYKGLGKGFVIITGPTFVEYDRVKGLDGNHCDYKINVAFLRHEYNYAKECYEYELDPRSRLCFTHFMEGRSLIKLPDDMNSAFQDAMKEAQETFRVKMENKTKEFRDICSLVIKNDHERKLEQSGNLYKGQQ